MALNTSQTAVNLFRQILRPSRSHNVGAFTRPLVTSSYSFSTSSVVRSEQSAEADITAPRWSRTPSRMKAPFSPHITQDPSRSQWKVNQDPKRLDDALSRFLGRDGERLLPDELKWLAVTHKSFDQGRRGFNDRLAFLGRQICQFEATESIITSPPNYGGPPADPFADRRQPFEDAGLRSLDNLLKYQPSDMFTIARMAKVAMDSGLSEVVRWKPRMPENIQGSGFNPVMAGAVYAVVGAIALQHGGKVASRVVRERIVKKIR